jgi:hypothetical protein
MKYYEVLNFHQQDENAKIEYREKQMNGVSIRIE